MAKNSKRFTKLALGALALGTAFTAANDAFALERGCQNADVVRAALRDEGQFVLVTAMRPIPEQPRNIFTSNATGTVGYNIEQGTGDTTGQLCVGIKYTDIQVNTNPDLSTPSWALMGANTPHDQWLESMSVRKNAQVLMGARVLRTERDANGNEMRGGFMMVTRGDVEQGTVGLNNSGIVSLTLSSGQMNRDLLLANIERQQPNYDAFANRGDHPITLAKN